MLLFSMAIVLAIVDGSGFRNETHWSIPLIIAIIYFVMASKLWGRLLGQNSVSNITVYSNVVIIVIITAIFGEFNTVTSNYTIYRGEDNYMFFALAVFLLWGGLSLIKNRTNDLVHDLLNNIEGSLQKQNDKRYEAKLDSIAKDSPEGKAAVDRIKKQKADTAKSFKAAARLNKKYR
jgi:hypothetical protein